MNRLEESLGSGVQYPNMFSDVRGNTEIRAGVNKIEQSIEDILTTRLGERFGKPEYGSRLYEVIFEPNDYIAMDLAKMYVKDALDRWEDRINVTSIDTKMVKNTLDGEMMNIVINFRINKSNLNYSYTYTLYEERR